MNIPVLSPLVDTVFATVTTVVVNVAGAVSTVFTTIF